MRVTGILSYLKRFRGFSRDTKFFLWSTVFGSVGMSVIWLMLNFYLQSLSYDQSFIGWINALPSLTIALLGLPIGLLSDRLPRKWGLVFGAALLTVGHAGVALLSDPIALVAFTVVGGIGFATTTANASPFLSENSSVLQRTALFSLFHAMSWITGLIGNAMGGAFPELFSVWFGGAANDTAALRATLVIVALLQFVSLIPLFFIKHKPKQQAAPQPTLPKMVAPQRTNLRAALPKRRILHIENPLMFAKLLLPTLLIGLGAGQTMPFLNLYIQGKFNISFAQLGGLFAAASVLTTMGLLLQPLLADRLGKVRSVVAVQVVSLPFIFILGFSPLFPLVAVAMMVRGMLMNMANPVYMAFCMEALPERERATFAGAQEGIWSIGWAASSAFSGWWRDQVGFEAGFNTAFVIMAVVYTLSTILLYNFFGKRERPAAYAPD